MNREDWDWSRRVVDHVDVHAGDYAESVPYLLDPDGNNVEALYRDVGNVGHGRAEPLR